MVVPRGLEGKRRDGTGTGTKRNRDGDGTGQGTQIPRGRLDYSDSGTATVFGANVDRSSCSCVEGNPCVDSTNCLDWKGRYTVAMMVRRRKGYFGEEGTNFQCNIF